MRSRAVQVGGVVAMLVGALACASGGDEYTEVETEYGEICVRHSDVTGEDTRVGDEECERGGSGVFWVWVFQRAGARIPAVGGVVQKGSYTTVRPGGTIARPPATGGFGTTRVGTVGS
jgi:hypothetical protein